MVAFIKLSRSNGINANTAYIFLESAVKHLSLELIKFDQAASYRFCFVKEYKNSEASKHLLRNMYQKDVDALMIEKDATKRDLLQERLGHYFAGLDQIDYSFFAAHPHSYITLYKLQSHFRKLPLGSFLLFYDRLSTQLKHNIIGQQIKERIQQIRGGNVGSKVKDFKALEPNRDSLCLANLKWK